MHLCYIDESGTPDIPGNTSHFVPAGLSIPIERWKECDQQNEYIKRKYGLEREEIHVGWILRPYLEQTRIPGFDALDYKERRSQVESLRKAELYRLQRSKNLKHYRQTRKSYRGEESYIHLSYQERRNLVADLARCVANWGFARLFAECVDKTHFDPNRTKQSISEQSFEQLVSRLETFLQIIEKNTGTKSFGLLIHDNNETVAKKHTDLMLRFFQAGTLWTAVKNIIETPLFVDSQLTSMVQVADMCSYALRRYLENGEVDLFDLVFQRADRKDGIVVGVRHFSDLTCSCRICTAHRRPTPP